MKTLILLAIVSIAAAQIQVQIPIRPQPPQQQFPQFPNFPVQPPQQQPPRFPGQPRFRQGEEHPNCPNPDDHNGHAFIFAGPTPTTFFICWGRIAWPFTCPGNTVFRTEVNSCADPGWTPEWQRQPIRPFNDDEDSSQE